MRDIFTGRDTAREVIGGPIILSSGPHIQTPPPYPTKNYGHEDDTVKPAWEGL